MDNFFDEVRAGLHGQRHGDGGGGGGGGGGERETAARCVAHYDADADGVLDRAEFQGMLADLLIGDDGGPAAVSDAVLERLWTAAAVATGEEKEKEKDGVDAAGLAAVWDTLVVPLLRPRAALLIVDVQNDFIDGTLALRHCPAGQDGAATVPTINRLRAAAPFELVVTTMDAHPQDHCSFIENVAAQRLHAASAVTAADAKAFDTVLLDGAAPVPQKLWPAHCVQGTWGERLHADLVVAPTDVVLRKGTRSDVDSYSAFWDNARLSATGLLEPLRRAGITHVVVCGLAFDVCVHATAMHAAEHGFRTVVVEDACAGVAHEGIAAARADMLAHGVHLTTADRVPALVAGQSRPAAFASS